MALTGYIFHGTDDTAAFNDEMERMLDRVSAEREHIPMMLDETVIDRARKDAERIVNGCRSTSEVTRPYRNILKSCDTDPDSSFFRKGEEYWKTYQKYVEGFVRALNSTRKLAFPEWCN